MAYRDAFAYSRVPFSPKKMRPPRRIRRFTSFHGPVLYSRGQGKRAARGEDRKDDDSFAGNAMTALTATFTQYDEPRRTVARCEAHDRHIHIHDIRVYIYIYTDIQRYFYDDKNMILSRAMI